MQRYFFIGLEKRKGVTYNVTFDPSAAVVKTKSIRVAVLREEGRKINVIYYPIKNGMGANQVPATRTSQA